jgi:abortive infection bacteriophage resistance protein
MTLGSILTLYADLKLIDDKRLISQKFGINQTTVFENYMEAIRCIRNICAHGSVLYDTKLFKEVTRGPAGCIEPDEKYRLGAAIKVIAYLIGTISTNRQHDLIVELNKAYMALINKNNALRDIVKSATHMEWDLASISQLQTRI